MSDYCTVLSSTVTPEMFKAKFYLNVDNGDAVRIWITVLYCTVYRPKALSRKVAPEGLP